MPDLTDADYDALFAVMQADMPRPWREIFPAMLAHFERTGALAITVTDTEVVVSSARLQQRRCIGWSGRRDYNGDWMALR